MNDISVTIAAPDPAMSVDHDGVTVERSPEFERPRWVPAVQQSPADRPAAGGDWLTTTRGIEIRVHIPYGKSELSDVLTLLAEQRLPTVTRSCTADQAGVILLLTTSQPEEVQRVLSAAGYRCETQSVILLGPTSSRPGAAAGLLLKLARRGVDIQYSYLSSIDPERCYLVFKTTDDEQLLKAIMAAA